MIGTMYKAYTGLEANGVGLNVIGNNLANMNTVGFKRGQANFSQLMTNVLDGASGNGNPVQFGLGVNTAEVVNYFNQGSFLATGVETHLALEGRGFFAVNINGNTSYTRAGNFSLTGAGELVTPYGGNVQGYTELNPDGTINTDGAIGNIVIDFETLSPAEPTSVVRFVSNLSAAATEGEEFISSLEIYDSNGDPQVLEIVFNKTATPGEWTYRFQTEAGDLSTTVPNHSSGTIQFAANGTLAEIDGTPIDQYQNRDLTISNIPNAEDLTFTWDLLDTDNPDNFGFLTNLGIRSNTGSVFQDGSSSGELQRIEFDRNGVMTGFFTNGDTIPLAHLALATFGNNQGLKQSNGSFFTATAASGVPTITPAGGALILSGVLEPSNVDIAEEFTGLIIHQRGFQSNSKSIQTADQVLQELVNLKR